MDELILKELKEINEKMSMLTDLNREMREIKVRLNEFLAK